MLRAKVDQGAAGKVGDGHARPARAGCVRALSKLERRMPRFGALTLSDIDSLFLWIGCEPCGRRGRYRVTKLRATYGDETLPTLLDKLSGCSKAGRASFSDRCQARYVVGPET